MLTREDLLFLMNLLNELQFKSARIPNIQAKLSVMLEVEAIKAVRMQQEAAERL